MNNKISKSQKILLINQILNIVSDCRFKLLQLKLSSDEVDFPFETVKPIVSATFHQIDKLVVEINEINLDLIYPLNISSNDDSKLSFNE